MPVIIIIGSSHITGSFFIVWFQILRLSFAFLHLNGFPSVYWPSFIVRFTTSLLFWYFTHFHHWYLIIIDCHWYWLLSFLHFIFIVSLWLASLRLIFHHCLSFPCRHCHYWSLSRYHYHYRPLRLVYFPLPVLVMPVRYLPTPAVIFDDKSLSLPDAIATTRYYRLLVHCLMLNIVIWFSFFIFRHFSSSLPYYSHSFRSHMINIISTSSFDHLLFHCHLVVIIHYSFFSVIGFAFLPPGSSSLVIHILSFIAHSDTSSFGFSLLLHLMVFIAYCHHSMNALHSYFLIIRHLPGLSSLSRYQFISLVIYYYFSRHFAFIVASLASVSSVDFSFLRLFVYWCLCPRSLVFFITHDIYFIFHCHYSYHSDYNFRSIVFATSFIISMPSSLFFFHVLFMPCLVIRLSFTSLIFATIHWSFIIISFRPLMPTSRLRLVSGRYSFIDACFQYHFILR